MKLKDLIEDNPYAPKLKDLYKVLEMYEKNKKKNQSLKDFISEMEKSDE